MSLPSVRRILFGIVETSGTEYRPDIDGLRAVAVLAVVAYHYFPSLLPGGFIGVDIFFVISGYLITRILAKSFELESFGASLARFYQHRIRRIFPALILTLGLCLGIGWLCLFSSEYAALGKHIAAGAGFIQNIVLWREAGYFDTTAVQKPLLHLWSLAVEEQFYIFWPFILWLIMRMRWPIMASIAIIAGLSFALNIWGIQQAQADAVFYLPATRAWELMIGAWLAASQKRGVPWLTQYAGLQAWCGLSLIICGFILIRPDRGDFPGFWALLPSVGTALIINAGYSGVAYVNHRILSLRAAVGIGLISYPLYLWHWALWSLAVVIFDDSVGLIQMRANKIVCLILSFLLSWATYRWIEQPIRKYRRTSTAAATAAMAVALLGFAGVAVYITDGLPNRAYTFVSEKTERYLASIERSPRTPECFGLIDDTHTLSRTWSCTLGDENSDIWIAAYGDSHALSLLPALERYGKEQRVRILFAGLSGCPPLLGIFPERPSGRACVELSKRMISLMEERPAAAVMLMARWTYYIGGTTKPDQVQKIRSIEPHGSDFPAVYGVAALRGGLQTTLSHYRSLDIPVILVEDNPQQLTGVPSSVARFDREVTDETLNSGSVTLEEHRRNQSEANDILESEAEKRPLVDILNMDAALCNSIICPWAKNGGFLYFDDDHLSIAGAMVVYPLLEARLNKIIKTRKGAKIQTKMP